MVSEKSTLSELTRFLFYSFQEKERDEVEDILTKRENDLKDEIKKVKLVLEIELEKQRAFVAQEKKKVEELIKSKMEFEVKVNEQCGALVKERDLKIKMLEDEMKENFEKELEKERDFVAMEKKRNEELIKQGYLKQKMLEDELIRLRENYEKVKGFLVDEKRRVEKLKEHCGFVDEEGVLKEQMYADEVKKLRESYDKELAKERGFVVMEKKKVEKLKEQCDALEKQGRLKRKMFEDEMKRLREHHEQELKKQNGFVAQEKKEVEKLKHQCDIVEKEGYLKKKMLEDEVNRLKENYEEESDLMKTKLSLAYIEKIIELEEKMKQIMELEEKMKQQCDVVEEWHLEKKMLEDEVKRLRENYEKRLEQESDLMKNEQSLASLEKKEVEDKMARECEMHEMHRETMQKDFKAELGKLRECHKKELENKISWVILKKLTLEEELRKSRMEVEEPSENKLILAASEKMNYEEELSMRINELEDKIEGSERKNSELEKELEFYKESVCIFEDFVKRVKGVYDSPMNANVRANEGLSTCKSREKEKRGCSFLEKESEDGGYNENNLRCKKRRIIDGSKGDKDTPAAEENTERLELVRYKRPPSNDFSRKLGAVGPNISDANTNLRTDSSGTDENAKIQCTKLVGGVVDDIAHCSAHSRVDSHVVLSENKEVAGFQTSKEITWSQSADMLSAFRTDLELCMAVVCPLYRQHISAGNPSNRGVLGGVDIPRATDVAKYLVKKDAEYKLSRSVLEVQQDWPHRPDVLQTCKELAIQYKEQLFEIYQKNLDPFFCEKS